MLKWPWRRKASSDRVVVAAGADRFAYAWAGADGTLRRCGVEERGSDTAAEFQRRLRALGLPARGACAVLPLADAQLMQIEAPAVKPEELKAAARWRIKDQVDGRPEDLTIDVMPVGDDRPRPNRHLFVAAAREATIRAAVELARAAGLEPAVVDIAETAQRNLQTRIAAAAGFGERASAALVRHGAQALLTICAGGELYDARRLDWEALRPAAPAKAAEPALESLVDETLFESADFVDYGAEAEAAEAAEADHASRLVVELQRSFDLWERSWPDLPLAGLWVQAGEESGELATLLAVALGQRVAVLDPAEVLPGFAQAAPSAALRTALLPILGALWRDEPRRP